MAQIIAISWTILVLVAAPLAGMLSRRALTDRVRPRSIIYASSAINLVLIGIVTAAIDLWRGGQTIAALTAVLPLSRLLMWSIGVSFGCVAVSIGIFFLRGKLDRPPSTIVMQLMPQKRIEYALFVALCLLIGLVEEFLFRRFAFFTLTGLLHSKIPAIAIVTVFFCPAAWNSRCDWNRPGICAWHSSCNPGVSDWIVAPIGHSTRNN